jgi:hypothetical protein
MADEASKELRAPAGELVKLARAELGEMTTRKRVEGFLELNARRARSTQQKRLVLTVAAALAVAAFTIVGYRWAAVREAGVLSYAVDGGSIDSSGALEAKGDGQPTLRFSDGTEVAFHAGARGRVKAVGEHGARIAMSGKVHVNVVHWRGSRWLFDAGPFLITVTGTSFTADWREAEGRLEVSLETGAIAVSGPLSDEAITLRAGQQLIISTHEKQVIIREIGSGAAAGGAISASPPSSQPLLEEGASPGSSPASRPAASASPLAAPSWTAELAAGRFAIILQQAEQRGLDKVIAQVSSDELAALSDAARYSRRPDVARPALAAQRRRFAGSARANDAAFLLGRLEETAGNAALALDWYERCLSESPQGAYVSEALGRKMTVVQRVHGAARARPIAEEYLRRFGNGTYAAAARALIRTR